MELNQPKTSLPLSQFVKMTAPIFVFGVILPLVDTVTDLRMIIRLFGGVQACSTKGVANSYDADFRECLEAKNFTAYCQDNQGRCETERHPIFASVLFGNL